MLLVYCKLGMHFYESPKVDSDFTPVFLISYRFSWDRIRSLCQLRRRYIQLYAGSLQHLSNVNNAEIREIEKDLDSKVILLWR